MDNENDLFSNISPIEPLLALMSSDDNYTIATNALDMTFNFTSSTNYDKLKSIASALMYNQGKQYAGHTIQYVSIHAVINFDRTTQHTDYVVYSKLDYNAAAEFIKQFYNIQAKDNDNFERVFSKHEKEIYDKGESPLDNNYKLQHRKIKTLGIAKLKLIFYFSNYIRDFREKARLSDKIKNDIAKEENDYSTEYQYLEDVNLDSNMAQKEIRDNYRKFIEETEHDIVEQQPTTSADIEHHIVEDNIDTIAHRVKTNKRSTVFKGKYGKGLSLQNNIIRAINHYESYDATTFHNQHQVARRLANGFQNLCTKANYHLSRF